MIIIYSCWITNVSKSLFVASQTSAIVIAHITIILTSVPTTSALCQPNDRVLVAFFYAIYKERMEIAKPTKSENRCAESVRRAIEFERIAPVTSTARNTIDSEATKNNFLIAFLFDSSYIRFRCKKFIGVFTAIGVPRASGMSFCFESDS